MTVCHLTIRNASQQATDISALFRIHYTIVHKTRIDFAIPHISRNHTELSIIIISRPIAFSYNGRVTHHATRYFCKTHNCTYHTIRSVIITVSNIMGITIFHPAILYDTIIGTTAEHSAQIKCLTSCRFIHRVFFHITILYGTTQVHRHQRRPKMFTITGSKLFQI